MSSILDQTSFGRTTFVVFLVIVLLGGCAGQSGQYVEESPGASSGVYSGSVDVVEAASITNVGFEEQEGLVRVVISGSEPLTYNISQTESPLGVVVDVPGVRLDAPTNRVPVYLAGITEISASEAEEAGQVSTRVAIGLDTYTDDYQVIPWENDLAINFRKPPVVVPEPVEVEEIAEPEPIVPATTVVDAVVEDVGDYAQVDIVADGAIDEYRSFALSSPTRLVLDLPAMQSGVAAMKKECLSAHVSAVRFGVYPDYVRVVIDSPTEDLPPYQVVSSAQGLRVLMGSGFETEAVEEMDDEVAVSEEIVIAEETEAVEEASEAVDALEVVEGTDEASAIEAVEVVEATEDAAEGEVVEVAEEIETPQDSETGGGLAMVAIAGAAELDAAGGQDEAVAAEESDPVVGEEASADASLIESEGPVETVDAQAGDEQIDIVDEAAEEPVVEAAMVEADELVAEEAVVAEVVEEVEEPVEPATEEPLAVEVAEVEVEATPEPVVEEDLVVAELTAEEEFVFEEEPIIEEPVVEAEESIPVEEPQEEVIELEPEEEIIPTMVAIEEKPEIEEEPPRYIGEHISLDFKDADIKNILRLIAEISDLNVVAGDDVSGRVTIRLTDVPWDQALEVILLSNGLGMDLQGNILRVAPIDRINREREKALEARKKAEKLEPLRKGLVPVSYADVRDLRNVITSSKLLSSRGSVQFDKRTNTMIVIDIDKSVREVQRMIYELDTPTPQVLIESKIVQINPTYTKELGVTWEAGFTTTMDNSIIGIGGNDGVSIDGETGQVTTEGPQIDLAPAVGQGAGGAISFGILNNNFGLFGKIAALEKDEKLEIISSPRIMTLDNLEAQIEQGVDLPYLKLSEEGVTSTEFKKATLALKVTPHVTADDSIQMDVQIKKDQKSAQTGAGGEPGIDTRRAETNVLVRSGDTVVIGGIYEETMTDINSSVPFFGKLPIIGWAFKGTKKQSEKIELIIFITPSIVTIEKAPVEEAIWISDGS